MREKIYYMLAIAVLLVAISALVVVFGQNQPLTSQPAQQSSASGATLQSMFTTLGNRVNQDANFAFRIRVAAAGNSNTITVGKGGVKITDVGVDFFCVSSTPPSKVCYPFAQLLAVAI